MPNAIEPNAQISGSASKSDRNRQCVLVVAGTRPEAIKLAPVVLALNQQKIKCKVLVTGQHPHLISGQFELFGVCPHIALEVNRGNEDVLGFAGIIMRKLGEILQSVRPSCVVVQGDTTSALVGAVAAYYHGVPVAHVEAGLRSGDLYEPWPEEGNRRAIAAVADLHFAPTAKAQRALVNEGIKHYKIFVVGNTVIDAALHVYSLKLLEKSGGILRTQYAQDEGYCLVTLHRRDKAPCHIEAIIRKCCDVASSHGLEVIWPVHPNPRVQEASERLGNLPHLRRLPPLDYVEFLKLLIGARVVVSDSGGLQEEAVLFRRPIIVARRRTERPEGMSTGLLHVAGTKPDEIAAVMEQILKRRNFGEGAPVVPNPYGDGMAGHRIASIILSYLRDLVRGGRNCGA